MMCDWPIFITTIYDYFYIIAESVCFMPFAQYERMTLTWRPGPLIEVVGVETRVE